MIDLVLVDENDNPIGTMEKMAAHRQGLLHRAFSVFIFNRNGELLLQKRALSKYHCGGLWSNTCCSHPFPGEPTAKAAERRLQEEMGFTLPLTKIFDFVYKVPVDNGLVEHEFDHVFVGTYEGPIAPNSEDVSEYKFISLQELEQKLEEGPHLYTHWLNMALPRVKKWFEENLVQG